MAIPKFQEGDICTFTNKGGSGYTGNDGKECQVLLIKPKNMWRDDEPGYVVAFLHNQNTFGVRECELASKQN